MQGQLCLYSKTNREETCITKCFTNLYWDRTLNSVSGKDPILQNLLPFQHCWCYFLFLLSFCTKPLNVDLSTWLTISALVKCMMEGKGEMTQVKWVISECKLTEGRSFVMFTVLYIEPRTFVDWVNVRSVCPYHCGCSSEEFSLMVQKSSFGTWISCSWWLAVSGIVGIRFIGVLSGFLPFV